MMYIFGCLGLIEFLASHPNTIIIIILLFIYLMPSWTHAMISLIYSLQTC